MFACTVIPRDPVIARDGRPFGNSGDNNRMHCLSWPLPSTTAGTIRTMVGKSVVRNHGRSFTDPGFVRELKKLLIRGPFAQVSISSQADPMLYFPRPQDASFDGDSVVALRPQPLGHGEGCDMPSDRLWPIQVDPPRKPGTIPGLWSLERYAQWQMGISFVGSELRPKNGFIDLPALDQRVHVSLDARTRTAEDAKLFMTEGLAFPIDPQMTMLLFVDAQGTSPDIGAALAQDRWVHSLGGERRVAFFEFKKTDGLDRCPRELASALSTASAVRLTLATPGLFQRGWCPGWIDPETLEGSPPGQSLRLRLRGACMRPWQPISGWSIEEGKVGPKPSRRMVPAGSVYFFEVIGGRSGSLSQAWMQSVCDEVQDRCDGFGIGLWGIWKKGGSRYE